MVIAGLLWLSVSVTPETQPWESILQRGEGEQTSDVSERRVDRGAQPGRAKLLTRARQYL